MKRLKNVILIFLSICSLFFLCGCEKKNYNVEIRDGVVNVKMHSPSMGIVGFNQVSYDGFTYEEVEKEIFDKIRSRNYDGSYMIFVCLQFLDNYGNYYDGENILVSNLSAIEVKKYASYGFFKGQTHLEKAFPWNRDNSSSITNSGNDTSYSNNNSTISSQQSTIQNFNYTGNWECPDLYHGGMDVCLVLTHNTSSNSISVDYLVNYRIWDYDNAIGWIEGSTLHVSQKPDVDGNYIELVATPINRTTIKGTLRYKNPHDSYNGELIMRYRED